MLNTIQAQTNKASSSISHVCPFCGGPVVLSDNEIIAACDNCGSMLRLLPSTGMQSFIISSNFPQREAMFFLNRELKTAKQPLVRKQGEVYQIYLPFYYVQGKIFNYNKQLVEHKRVSVTATGDGPAAVHEYTTTSEEQKAMVKKCEMSMAAYENPQFGIESLGVRTSVLKLAPLSPIRAKEKLFHSCDRDVNYALSRYDKAVNRNTLMSGQKSLARFSKALYPEVSLVYMPVWVVNYQSSAGDFYAILDSVAKGVVAIHEGNFGRDELTGNDDIQGSLYEMVKHRCGYCGFDLPRQKNGELFICSNCGRIYKTQGEGYKQIKINLPRMDFDDNARMFPFWMFTLATSADNDRLKQALKLENDTIFVPAFEICNLKRAAHVSLSYSKNIDRIDFDKLEENSYPVSAATLDRQAAERMILPLLLSGRDYIEHLDLESLFKLQLEFDDVMPVWLPFVEESYFYVGQMIGLGFEKSAVD